VGYYFKKIPLSNLCVAEKGKERSEYPEKKLEISIERFGVLSPLVVVDNSRESRMSGYNVMDGVKRYRILEKKGCDKNEPIPCYVVDREEVDQFLSMVQLSLRPLFN